MDIMAELRRVAEMIGERVDDSLLEDHRQYCEQLEEYIYDDDCASIVRELMGAIACMWTLNRCSEEALKASRVLQEVVINRVRNDKPELAEEVKQKISELAQMLLSELVSETRVNHRLH